METIKFSVIIPIYNAEKYLKKTIESVLNQTANLELILVDDGSVDKSGEICDFYQKTDERVKVIHQKNGGICAARNVGIKMASGTHVSFLDADDFVDGHMYEQIQPVLAKENPDILDFGWKYINNQGDITENLHKLPKNCMLGYDVIHEKILPPLLNLKKDQDNFIYDFSVNKIYKKDILKEHNILFDEARSVWEDRPFVIQYLKYCKTFYSMDQCFYNYVSVTDSLSRRYHMEFFDVILKNYWLYRDLFGDEYDFETSYVWNHWSHSIENMIYRSLGETQNQTEIEQNILKTLQNPEVKKWFEHREAENEFERQVSEAVKNGDTVQALNLYKEKYQKDQKRPAGGRFKSLIRKMLK